MDIYEDICRCSSFRLLTPAVFDVVLEKENEKRIASGDTALTREGLFNKLPPFLQKSDRMIEIQQYIPKTEAAASDGLDEIKAAGKSRVGLE